MTDKKTLVKNKKIFLMKKVMINTKENKLPFFKKYFNFEPCFFDRVCNNKFMVIYYIIIPLPHIMKEPKLMFFFNNCVKVWAKYLLKIVLVMFLTRIVQSYYYNKRLKIYNSKLH